MAEGRQEMAAFVGKISDEKTKALFETEREVLMRLNADCSEPAAAFAEWQADGNIRLRAMYGERYTEQTAPAADRLEMAAEAAGRLKT